MGSTERIRKLHPKKKGNLGELRVAADLAEKGYPVFTELGVLSQVDLIAETNPGEFIRIQVKCLRSQGGAVRIDRQKSGPGYRFKYRIRDVDLFAIYVYDRKLILYVPSEVICGRSRQTSFRIDPPRNGQTTEIRLAEEFISFEAALEPVDSEPL